MRIGYLASGLFSSYNSLVWSGIHEACHEKNAIFVYFSGGELQSPLVSQAIRNPIFDLATRDVVDGILVNTGTTFHFVERAIALEFLQKRVSVPMVNIGVRFGPWPTVMTDPSNGINDMVGHLVRDHGYSRIAFITGPKNSAESDQRLESFRSALQKFGAEFRPGLVAHGMFTMETGETAFDQLLASGQKFDAIVAANDYLAIGAIGRANAFGISVPSQLAVCGFDDIDLAQRFSVTLTTVRQPIKDQAKEACRALIRQLEGGPPAEDIVLPTSFVRRCSCGCMSSSIERAGRVFAKVDFATKAAVATEMSGAEAIRANYERILNELELFPRAGAPEPAEAMSLLLDCLCLALESKDTLPALLKAKGFIIEAGEQGFEDYGYWEDLISELIGRTSPWAGSDGDTRRRFEAFSNQLRILIQELAYQSQYDHRMKDANDAIRLRETNWKLIQCFETEKLMRTIATEFPTQGVKACYLCAGGKLAGEDGPPRVLLAYDESGATDIPAGGLAIPDGYLVPPEVSFLDDPGVYFLEALFFETEGLGYILFRTDPAIVPIEELRRQVSSALKGAFLSEEVRSLAAEERERAIELQEAVEGIKKSLAEKETLIRELYHRTKNNMSVINALLGLQADFFDNVDLREAFAETQGRIRSMALVHEKLYEAKDLSRINLITYIDDLSNLLMKSYATFPVVPSFVSEAEDLFVLIDIAIPIGLILNELISNALKHAFPKGRTGEIRVIIHREESGEILLGVSDNGVGLPPGFDIWRDGHMGMKTLLNLAESQLDGKVSIDTKKGFSFQARFRDEAYEARI